MKESAILCPQDGQNLFVVSREPDTGLGDPQNVAVLCKRCQQREFFEALRNARVIQLDRGQTQKLKLS